MYFQNNFPILRRIESYMVIVHIMYIVQLHISCKSLCNHKFSIVSTQFFNISETFVFLAVLEQQIGVKPIKLSFKGPKLSGNAVAGHYIS